MADHGGQVIIPLDLQHDVVARGGNGHAIGIEEIGAANSDRISIFSCVSKQDMWKYAEPKSMYDLKAWHISKLKIYGRSKELSEFYRHDDSYDNAFGWAFDDRTKSIPITRPPQNWCYVEEI